MKLTWSELSLALDLGFVENSTASNVAKAETLVGLSTSNQIGVFDSTNVAAASFVNISGLS